MHSTYVSECVPNVEEEYKITTTPLGFLQVCCPTMSRLHVAWSFAFFEEKEKKKRDERRMCFHFQYLPPRP